MTLPAACNGVLGCKITRTLAANELRWETSLSHMTRAATEARTRATAEWVEERIGDPRKRNRPPRGRGLRLRPLRRVPKSIAGRYYQLLSGHAAIDPYLKERIHRVTDDKRWWCGGGKQQTRYDLFVECRARRLQIT